jgi:16S rRNA (cytidine1402-2'-O)-methyltransferase
VSADREAAATGTPGGRLFVVATPIGNLADVTLRALDTLRAVPLIAAEDTRVTRRLLVRHGIDTPLTSFRARNATERLPELLGQLREGRDLAVVTDAGTPGISDPGAELAAAWGAEGGTVIPIPGPSAAVAAVAATGIVGPRWSFEGFLPRSGRERRERIDRLAGDERGAILFEAPDRLAGTLGDLAERCGSERPGAVCRELTKIHESVERGTLGRLAEAAMAGRIPARGEMTIVVGQWPGAREARPAVEDHDPAAVEAAARARVDALVGEGMGRAEAARRVARETGLSRRRLYGERAR